MTKAKERYLDLYPNIDVKKFRTKLRYDADTGRLWREYRADEWRIIKRQEHRVPGYTFVFDKITVTVHDAVWFLHYGKWPTERIVAVDGDLKNTKIDNLVLESTTKEYLGNFYVSRDGTKFKVEVRHDPYFRRINRFSNKYAAESWGKSQLLLYNKYAYATEASATYTSESKELPIQDVWFHKQHQLYEVRVRFNGQRKHYTYCKNLEDALEAHAKAQAEVNEIWGESTADFTMPLYPASYTHKKPKNKKTVEAVEEKISDE